jgi:hypothetical protein
MDDTPETMAAVDEAVAFLKYFDDLRDPRQRSKVTYPLQEVLLLCLLAVLAGAETITDIAVFGVRKIALLRRFRPFRDGTPTSATFWPRSTRSSSSSASLPGCQEPLASPRAWSPSTARPRAAPA